MSAWRWVFFLGCMPFFSACITTAKSSPRAFGGYSVGMRFSTNQRIAVIQTNDGLAGRRFALTPLSGESSPHSLQLYGGGDPEIIEKYCDEEGACSQPNETNLVAIVPAGLVFSIIRIERRKGVNIWFGRHDDTVIFADLLSDVAWGARVVDVTDLSVFMCCGRSANAEEESITPDLRLLSLLRSEDVP
jgi:hypothetical protein